jgi:hypothetical protein
MECEVEEILKESDRVAANANEEVSTKISRRRSRYTYVLVAHAALDLNR